MSYRDDAADLYCEGSPNFFQSCFNNGALIPAGAFYDSSNRWGNNGLMFDTISKHGGISDINVYCKGVKDFN